MSACVQCFILLVSDSITCLGNSLHIQPIRLFSSAKKLVNMLRTCARVRICWPGFSALWQTHKIFRSCLSHPHERTTYVLLERVYAHMVSCTRLQTICRNMRASSLDFHLGALSLPSTRMMWWTPSGLQIEGCCTKAKTKFLLAPRSLSTLLKRCFFSCWACCPGPLPRPFWRLHLFPPWLLRSAADFKRLAHNR